MLEQLPSHEVVPASCLPGGQAHVLTPCILAHSKAHPKVLSHGVSTGNKETLTTLKNMVHTITNWRFIHEISYSVTMRSWKSSVMPLIVNRVSNSFNM